MSGYGVVQTDTRRDAGSTGDQYDVLINVLINVLMINVLMINVLMINVLINVLAAALALPWILCR